MADYPPNVYPSQFEIGTTHTFQIERRAESKKNGSHCLQLAFNPANEQGLTRGTMWFSPPGDERHAPAEWAMLEAVAGIPDNGTFTATRKGKPWYWEINGQSCKPQEGPQTAPQGPIASAPAQAAAQVRQALQGPPVDDGQTLPDMALLYADCAAQAAKIAPAIQDGADGQMRFQIADSLFRCATVKGMALNYRQKREAGGVDF